MDEVVSVLCNVAGDSSGWLACDLNTKPITEYTAVPVSVVRCRFSGEVGRFGRTSPCYPEDASEEVPADVLGHMSPCLVLRQRL